MYRKGDLWRALRASVAIPGVLPPVVDGGEVMVDGGLINNLPVDVMSQLGRGPVIGIDVSRDRALVASSDDLDGHGLQWLLPNRRRSAPSIFSLLIRAGTVSSDAQSKLQRGQSDLQLEPPLDGIDLLDWWAFERAVEVGYRYTMESLERVDVDLSMNERLSTRSRIGA